MYTVYTPWVRFLFDSIKDQRFISQAQTIPSSWFRYKRIDSYPRPVFCFHFFGDTLRMLVEVDRWEWSHDHFPSVPSDVDTLFSNSFQMFCRDFEPRLCSLAVGLLRDDHVWPATSKMRGPQCMGKTPRRCAMVMVWDPSCWWIDGVLMLSALGGGIESWLFQCFYFSGVFYSRNWRKLLQWWKLSNGFLENKTVGPGSSRRFNLSRPKLAASWRIIGQKFGLLLLLKVGSCQTYGVLELKLLSMVVSWFPQ